MGRLFGTDGARGVANTELTIELAMNIGRAAAMVLTSKEVEHPTFLIGKDTRLSGDMLEGALIAGLCSVGANVKLLGVVPTPAVAHLVKKYKADAGIMISASHNPYEFNGIKIFSSEGYKLPDELEEKIEAIILDNAEPYTIPAHEGFISVCLPMMGALASLFSCLPLVQDANNKAVAINAVVVFMFYCLFIKIRRGLHGLTRIDSLFH